MSRRIIEKQSAWLVSPAKILNTMVIWTKITALSMEQLLTIAFGATTTKEKPVINLNELEIRCKEASQGEWTTEGFLATALTNYVLGPIDASKPYSLYDNFRVICENASHFDSHFIASMNPQTALALIRVARAAKDALPDMYYSPEIYLLKQALEAVE